MGLSGRNSEFNPGDQNSADKPEFGGFRRPFLFLAALIFINTPWESRRQGVLRGVRETTNASRQEW